MGILILSLSEMKRIIAALWVMAISTIGLYSCHDELKNGSPEGSWKVISYDDFANNTHTYKNSSNTWFSHNNGDVTLILEDIDDTHGELQAVAVSNDVNGKYEFDQYGYVTFYDLITTLVGQPEWADWFANIGHVDSYEQNGSNLVLFYNEKKNGITLTRIP